MATILTRENESSSIEKLAAQREVYSLAKLFFYGQTFIAVIIPVLLSFSQLLFPKMDLMLIIATYSIVAVLADNFIEQHISNLKEKAAKIQEFFDTYVLNIKWNDILCSEKPEYNEIYNYHSKQIQRFGTSKLQNWYEPEIEDVPERTGKIICQKVNCNYNSSIRKKCSTVALIICVTTILLIILFTIFSEISLSKIILLVLFPAVPIIQWTHKIVLANNDSITNLEQLNTLINSTWNNLRAGNNIDDRIIRQIQDGIYLNRKGSLLIPDYIYNKLRDTLEEQTRYSVAELVKEING